MKTDGESPVRQYEVVFEDNKHWLMANGERSRIASAPEVYISTIATRGLSGAEALFGFFGLLIGESNQSIPLETEEDCKNFMEIITIFCQRNELAPPREGFQETLR